MSKTIQAVVIASLAILHNGKRYEQGDSIELTQEEFNDLSLYVALHPDTAEKQAEQQRLEAERKAKEIEQKKLEAERKAKEAEQKKLEAEHKEQESLATENQAKAEQSESDSSVENEKPKEAKESARNGKQGSTKNKDK